MNPSLMWLMISACRRGTTTTDASPTHSTPTHSAATTLEPPPLCEDVPHQACEQDALQVSGCVGTKQLWPYEPAIRTCYADAAVDVGCDVALGRPCPTFLDYLVDRGFLDPDFERERSNSWQPDTGLLVFHEHHLETAFDCTTESGRRFSVHVVRDWVYAEDFGSYPIVSDQNTETLFDEQGKVEAVLQHRPTCCQGEATDEVWWGDSSHPSSMWCAYNPTCDPIVQPCVELTADDIRARLENQRR